MIPGQLSPARSRSGLAASPSRPPTARLRTPLLLALLALLAWWLPRVDKAARTQALETPRRAALQTSGTTEALAEGALPGGGTPAAAAGDAPAGDGGAAAAAAGDAPADNGGAVAAAASDAPPGNGEPAAAAAAARPAGVTHVYVVGCGHSGTSVVKRTLANLPGMHCIPKESNAFVRLAKLPGAVSKQLAAWDAEAAAAGFGGWVEKTPKHIERLGAIWEADPTARVVLVVRDGRDVAASLLERRLPLAEAMQRWVSDNTHVLPHLGDPRLAVVRYEEFADRARVLGVLRRLAAFVGAPAADDERLLLALQPPSAPLPAGHQCAAFGGEAAKLADLTASYLALLAQRGDAARGSAPRAVHHNAYRSWQASQAWTPQLEPTWPRRLTCRQQSRAAGSEELRAMLQRFGYDPGPPHTPERHAACLAAAAARRAAAQAATAGVSGERDGTPAAQVPAHVHQQADPLPQAVA